MPSEKPVPMTGQEFYEGCRRPGDPSWDELGDEYRAFLSVCLRDMPALALLINPGLGALMFPMATVNITGISKVDLIQTLYANARPSGTEPDDKPLDRDNIQWGLDRGFGAPAEVNGRKLMCNMNGPEMDTQEYNRHNGEGEAERIVAELRFRDHDRMRRELLSSLEKAKAE